MVGSISGLRRQFRVSAPVMIAMVAFVIGVRGQADPTRRNTGYGGVLPIPNCPPVSSPGRLDPSLGQLRRDGRADRGRVLYATGHAPKAAQASSARPTRKAPCPTAERRVSQTRSPATPNS